MPVDTLAHCYPTPYRAVLDLPPVSPPPVVVKRPPPPPRPKPKNPKKLKWIPYDQTTRAILRYSAKLLRDGHAGIFQFVMQDQLRTAYKPPPPHWRSFSKMQPTDADDPKDRLYAWKKRKAK